MKFNFHLDLAGRVTDLRISTVDDGVEDNEDEPLIDDPPPMPPEDPSSPSGPSRKRAALMRFLKVTVYAAIGQLVSISGLLFVTLITDTTLNPTLAIVVGFFISGIAAGVHKAVNWQDAGVDAPQSPNEVMSASDMVTTIKGSKNV